MSTGWLLGRCGWCPQENCPLRFALLCSHIARCSSFATGVPLRFGHRRIHGSKLRQWPRDPHIRTMQNLELTDTEAPALVALLKNAIADDRFPPPPARPLAAPPP